MGALGAPSDIFFVLEDVGNGSVTMNIHGTQVKSTSRSAYDKAIEYLQPKKVRWVDSATFPTPAGAPEGPCAAQYLKWHICHALISQTERDENITYSHVVKSRPGESQQCDQHTRLSHHFVLTRWVDVCLYRIVVDAAAVAADLVIMRDLPPLQELPEQTLIIPYYEVRSLRPNTMHTQLVPTPRPPAAKTKC